MSEVLMWFVGSWLLLSVPFLLCKIIQTFQLFFFDKVLPLSLKNPDSRKEIRNIISDLDSASSNLPDWIVVLVLVILSLVLGFLSGMFWFINPSHNLRGLVECCLWEFEEV